jgi:ribosomal protein S18 acetylase RimI-like enzyme
VGVPIEANLDALLQDFSTQRGRDLFIASIDGEAVGVIGITSADAECGVITHIAVDSTWQGRGIGRSLIEWTASYLGLRMVEAETDREAVGFYRACGFVIESLGKKYPGVERFRCIRCF